MVHALCRAHAGALNGKDGGSTNGGDLVASLAHLPALAEAAFHVRQGVVCRLAELGVICFGSKGPSQSVCLDSSTMPSKTCDATVLLSIV